MKKLILTFIICLISSLILLGCGETPPPEAKEITGITFENVTLNYDGTQKSIEVDGELPTGVTVTYTNNKATNAGTYDATATLKGDGYKDLILSATLKINKINITGITFTNKTFDYDGTERTILVDGEIPQDVTATYTNNKGTNAGEYNATATLKGSNYNDLVLTATLKINKISYDMTNAKWDYTTPFTYDGNEKIVSVTGLPTGVTVKEYTNNKNTEEGDYTATVKFNYDDINYLEPTLSPCEWTIDPKPETGLKGLANTVISSFGSVPTPWSFLPESFSPENRTITNVVNYDNFVQVNSIPKNGMGKQLNVVYGVLNKTTVALEYVSKVYAVLNTVKNLYSTYLESDPTEYKNFSGTALGIDFTLILNEDQYLISATVSNVGITIYSNVADSSYGAKVQLTQTTILKYTVSENELVIALDILDSASTLIEFARGDDAIVGMVYEYLTLGDKQITATSAMITVDANYTTLIGTKGDFIPTSVSRNCEVYRNTDGCLVGTEVREEIEISKLTDTYNTLWYNLYNVSGITSIKKVDEMNGTNADTIYINGSTDTIHTKLGGLTAGKKAASRRFDIEFKTMYFYQYNQDTKEYEEVKMEIPMLFVQEEFLEDFSEDFYDKNESALSSEPTITLSESAQNAVNFGYYTLLIEYDKLKDEVTHQDITDYCKQ